jgi:hypothetical protein
MKKLVLKSAFPQYYYSYAKVKIRTSSGRRYVLHHMQYLEIDVENEEWLKFRNDQHGRKLFLEKSDAPDQAYAVVTIETRENPILNLIDALFRNRMSVKIVNKEAFDRFETDVVKPAEYKVFRPADNFMVALSALIFLGFVLYSLFTPQSANFDRDYVFIINLICLLSLGRLFFQRQTFRKGTYKMLTRFPVFFGYLWLIFIEFSSPFKEIMFSITSILFFMVMFWPEE